MSNKYEYLLTPLALQDLDETLAYITEKLSNGKAAGELLNELEHTLDSICSYPYAFPDCSVFLISDTSIRHVPIKNYILVYRIQDAEKQVYILRFRYAGTNITNTPMEQDNGQ